MFDIFFAHRSHQPCIFINRTLLESVEKKKRTKKGRRRREANPSPFHHPHIPSVTCILFAPNFVFSELFCFLYVFLSQNQFRSHLFLSPNPVHLCIHRHSHTTMEQRTTARFHPYGGRRNRRHHSNNNHEQQPELVWHHCYLCIDRILVDTLTNKST